MVFPLYDDNPFKRARVPYVTWGLIVVNVGIFLLEVGATDDAVKALLASFAATPAAITHQAPGGSLPPELPS
jgi:membrane associated rhomboid family serine protease